MVDPSPTPATNGQDLVMKQLRWKNVLSCLAQHFFICTRYQQIASGMRLQHTEFEASQRGDSKVSLIFVSKQPDKETAFGDDYVLKV